MKVSLKTQTYIYISYHGYMKHLGTISATYHIHNCHALIPLGGVRWCRVEEAMAERTNSWEKQALPR